jgi:hypothetical protein
MRQVREKLQTRRLKPGEKLPAEPELAAKFGVLEGLLRERLVVDCVVDLMPPGTLPRFEMKAQLIRKLYDEPLLSGGG